MKKQLFIYFSLSTLFLSAQWADQVSGFPTAARGINSINIVTADTAWAGAFDGSAAATFTTNFTKTINGGTVWGPGTITTGVSGVGLANISAIDASTAWACIFHPSQASAAGIWKTVDGGSLWTQQTTAAFVANSFPDFVHFWDANNGIAVGDPINSYFEVYTTTDGGTIWTRTANTANHLSPSSTAEYGYTNGFSVMGDTLWFSTTAGRVFKTVDKGFTFTNAIVGNGITDVQRISFANSTIGYVAMHNPGNLSYKLARTFDGGLNWFSVPTSILILGGDVCAVPGTNALVAVGSDTTRAGSAWSSDNGNSWQLMEDTTGAPQRTSVKFLNATTGWAGAFNADAFTKGISKYTGVAIGVNQKEISKNNISVYPNPVTEYLNLNLIELGGKKLTIEVFNLIGAKIYSENFYTEAPVYIKHINVSNFAKGIYFVQVSDGQSKSVQKFIKE